MADHLKRRVREGLPYPLGAHWDGEGVNFALFSAHATKVEVCLFDTEGVTELDRVTLPEYTDQIFHGWLMVPVDPGRPHQAEREVSSGTLSNTLQVMKKRGAVKSAGGKWMLPKTRGKRAIT